MSAAPGPRPVWRRWLLWPALGLLALNVVTFAVYTFPRGLQERTLAARAVSLREEMERESRVNEGLRGQSQVIGANARDMQRFLKQVVAGHGSLSTILEELERTARDLGLRTEHRGYSREELDKLPLVRFEVALPLAGSYGQLMGFLDALERFPRFVIVDQVRFRDHEGGAPGLSLTISAYFAREAGNAP